MYDFEDYRYAIVASALYAYDVQQCDWNSVVETVENACSMQDLANALNMMLMLSDDDYDGLDYPALAMSHGFDLMADVARAKFA